MTRYTGRDLLTEQLLPEAQVDLYVPTEDQGRYTNTVPDLDADPTLAPATAQPIENDLNLRDPRQRGNGMGINI